MSWAGQRGRGKGGDGPCSINRPRISTSSAGARKGASLPNTQQRSISASREKGQVSQLRLRAGTSSSTAHQSS